MNLFIQALTTNGTCILFNDRRELLKQSHFSLLSKESSSLLTTLKAFLQESSLDFSHISEIVLVHWPGSFTGIRSITLIVNTLAFVFPNISLTALSYFDLFSDYPILKQSSKRDVFTCFWKGEEVHILPNEVCLKKLKDDGVKKVFWEVSFDLEWIMLENTPDYATICKNIVFQNKKRIAPLYIKAPNIS